MKNKNRKIKFLNLFLGKQKLVDTAGRVDRFNKRYARGAAATTPTE